MSSPVFVVSHLQFDTCSRDRDSLQKQTFREKLMHFVHFIRKLLPFKSYNEIVYLNVTFENELQTLPTFTLHVGPSTSLVMHKKKRICNCLDLLTT